MSRQQPTPSPAVVSVPVPGLLLVLFVAFKLAGIINWSWFWVLAPMWAPVLAALLLFALAGALRCADRANQNRVIRRNRAHREALRKNRNTSVSGRY